MNKSDLIAIFISLFIQGIFCYWIGYFVGRSRRWAKDKWQEEGADNVLR